MEEIIENLKSVLLDETRYCSHEDRAYIMAELAQFAEGESRHERAMAAFDDGEDREEGGEA